MRFFLFIIFILSELALASYGQPIPVQQAERLCSYLIASRTFIENRKEAREFPIDELMTIADNTIQNIVDVFEHEMSSERTHMPSEKLVLESRMLMVVRSQLINSRNDPRVAGLIQEMDVYIYFTLTELALRELGYTMKLEVTADGKITEKQAADVMRGAYMVRGAIDPTSNFVDLQDTLKRYFQLGFFPQLPAGLHIKGIRP